MLVSDVVNQAPAAVLVADAVGAPLVVVVVSCFLAEVGGTVAVLDRVAELVGCSWSLCVSE